ncbi:MAG: ribosome maturation factor RimM [Pseudomonadota bacterium]
MADTGRERVELGRLDGAWGVSGWVKVYSFTDPPSNIFEYQPWHLEQSPGLIRVVHWKQQGPRLVAKLAHVDQREQAEALRGQALFVTPNQLPNPTDAEYYWRDLIGLEVVNRTGEQLGRIHRMLDASVHDVMCIRTADRDETLIPFVLDYYVDRVDLAQGRVQVDWPMEWNDAD